MKCTSIVVKVKIGIRYRKTQLKDENLKRGIAKTSKIELNIDLYGKKKCEEFDCEVRVKLYIDYFCA